MSLTRVDWNVKELEPQMRSKMRSKMRRTTRVKAVGKLFRLLA